MLTKRPISTHNRFDALTPESTQRKKKKKQSSNKLVMGQLAATKKAADQKSPDKHSSTNKVASHLAAGAAIAVAGLAPAAANHACDDPFKRKAYCYPPMKVVNPNRNNTLEEAVLVRYDAEFEIVSPENGQRFLHPDVVSNLDNGLQHCIKQYANGTSPDIEPDYHCAAGGHATVVSQPYFAAQVEWNKEMCAKLGFAAFNILPKFAECIAGVVDHSFKIAYEVQQQLVIDHANEQQPTTESSPLPSIALGIGLLGTAAAVTFYGCKVKNRAMYTALHDDDDNEHNPNPTIGNRHL